jgi:hypothetical protein
MAAQLILERLRLARSLPPGVVMRRAAGLVIRRLTAAAERRRDTQRPTRSTEAPTGPLNAVCNLIPLRRLAAQRQWIEPLAAQFMAHRFDLLGSGWVEIRHGMSCEGVKGVVYPPGPAVSADAAGTWLDGRINKANLPASRAIWQLIGAEYQPIDWQIDFKSGYRWHEDCWSPDIPFGEKDGIDVKVPWELARMQHLVILSLADALARAESAADAETSETQLQQSFRNQVLDFIATNPPRFGVNWRCSMDVSIRAANWVVAYGLFHANSARFDAPFEKILTQSLIDHGRHITTHLEFYPEGRSNHYLADIAGLAFIAASLPATNETDSWLAFAAQEIQGETQFQFNRDGSNFEGSTSYHCLSLEMATAATALLAGMDTGRLSAALTARYPEFRTRPTRRLALPLTPPGPEQAAALIRGAEFAIHITKPDGRIAQIGDNDDGRFFVPHPVRKSPDTSGNPGACESLDHVGLAAAITALTDEAPLSDAGNDRLDVDLIRSLARGSHLSPGPAFERRAATTVRVTAAPLLLETKEEEQTTHIIVPDGELRRGLVLFGYPDFGLWLFRSERMFLAVRCGPSVGKGSPGSHAHNDQLTIELAIDGEDWIADPGSYLYCPPITQRNAWRSVRAHAAPQWAGREPGRLDVGPFRMIDQAHAACLHFTEEGFAGTHIGFGEPVRRDVILSDDILTLRDTGLPPDPARRLVRCTGRDEARLHFRRDAPFSPGYGQLAGGET